MRRFNKIIRDLLDLTTDLRRFEASWFIWGLIFKAFLRRRAPGRCGCREALRQEEAPLRRRGRELGDGRYRLTAAGAYKGTFHCIERMHANVNLGVSLTAAGAGWRRAHKF